MSEKEVKNWKKFALILLYHFAKRFSIDNDDDIIFVKTSMCDGVGMGIKFNKIYTDDELGIPQLV